MLIRGPLSGDDLMNLFFRKTKKPAAAHGPNSSIPQTKESFPTLPQASVALQGNVAAIPLDDIFQLLNNGALTGELEVHGPDNIGSFFVRRGVLIYGLLHNNQRKLGTILVEAGLITMDQLNHSLGTLADSPEKRLGHVLLEHGMIHNEKLEEALKTQAREAFYEILTWQEGVFVFHKNRTPSEEEVLLAERIDSLLLQGMLQLDER
jgi:hypothetical protein